MEISVQKWYDVLAVRHSRRKYIKKELNKDDLLAVSNFVDKLNGQAKGFRISLVLDNCEKLFKGLIGSYGSIKGPQACAVFIIDENDQHSYEKGGYYGEAFILEATSLGLGTCWVGASFDKGLVKETIAPGQNEKIIAITPLGYVRDSYTLEEKLVSYAVSGHKRKPMEELCIGGISSELPEWVRNTLRCARLAPSAVNHQPWRFIISKEKIIVSAVNDRKENSNKLDCGIAMLHIEIGALYHGIQGKWNYLKYPQIAEYVFANA